MTQTGPAAHFFSVEMPPDEWADYMVREYNALADRWTECNNARLAALSLLAAAARRTEQAEAAIAPLVIENEQLRRERAAKWETVPYETEIELAEALTAALTRAEQAETERDAAMEAAEQAVSDGQTAALGWELSLARVRDLERERDEARLHLATTQIALEGWAARAKAWEDALDDIAVGRWNVGRVPLMSVNEFARAALVSGAAEGNSDE